jgi:hypothetical protein
MSHLACQSLLIRDGNLIIRDGNLVLCEDQVTLAAETDSALAVVALRTYSVGIASEVDTSPANTQPLTAKVVGIAREFDFAIPLGRIKWVIGDVITTKTLTATVRK